MPVLMMVNPWDRVINVTLAIMRYLTFASPGQTAGALQGKQGFGPPRAGRRHIDARNNGQGDDHYTGFSQRPILNRNIGLWQVSERIKID